MSDAGQPTFALEQGHTLDETRVARVRFTTAADGDLRVTQPPADVEPRRRRLAGYPWTWLHQVHESTVVTVSEPGEHAGVEADAAVTRVPGVVLAIHTADCAPVALVADEGVVGAVHAGWRGLIAGVVERTVDEMRRAGATRLRAVLGPCIHAECYEFGADDLAQMAGRCGEAVRGVTAAGRPALDLPAAVQATLRRAGVEALDDAGMCTACDLGFFSHRARGDTARQAMVVWMEGS